MCLFILNTICVMCVCVCLDLQTSYKWYSETCACVCETVYPCRQEVAPLPQFSLAFCLHSVLYSTAQTHTRTLSHTHTHTELQPTLRDGDRPCCLTQKLLILLSAAMNDLP